MVIPTYSVLSYYKNELYNMIYWGIELPSYPSSSVTTIIWDHILYDIAEGYDYEHIEEVDDESLESMDDFIGMFNTDIFYFGKHFNTFSSEWNFFLTSHDEHNHMYEDPYESKFLLEGFILNYKDRSPGRFFDCNFRPYDSKHFSYGRNDPDNIDYDIFTEDDDEDKDDNE